MIPFVNDKRVKIDTIEPNIRGSGFTEEPEPNSKSYDKGSGQSGRVLEYSGGPPVENNDHA